MKKIRVRKEPTVPLKFQTELEKDEKGRETSLGKKHHVKVRKERGEAWKEALPSGEKWWVGVGARCGHREALSCGEPWTKQKRSSTGPTV